jgi:OOP family OmpA-OmpF porin
MIFWIIYKKKGDSAMRKWCVKLLLCLTVMFLLTGFSSYAAVAEAGVGDLKAKVAAGVYVPKVENFEVILDSSASMADPYMGVVKLDIESFIVNRMNQTIPDMKISGALRNFGFVGFFSDEKTKLLYGLTAYSKQAFGDALKTPMATGINTASGDLKAANGRIAVIIVSDWDELGNTPAVAAADMKSKFGDRICIYPVMIGNNKDGKKLMDKVAQAGQCGFASNADEIASREAMETFVEKVFFTTATAKPVDSDRDGVPDGLDKCPGTPGGVQVDNDGCPLDSDKDGVPDYLDKCPGTPEGVTVDKDGCPPEVVKEVAPVKEAAPVVKETAPEVVSITLKLEFDTAKSNIKPKYNNEIKKVADFMKKYPGTKAEIQGHTDNVGREAANVKLSQARAGSVMKYLITKFGIAKERLTAVGYGPKKPVASNATKEGKQQNRRVEAVIQTTVNK